MLGQLPRPLLLLLLLLALPGVAQAQPQLSVNGSHVPGLTLNLVPGISYAPAQEFAQTLGATMMVDYGSGRLTLELGGRLVGMPVSEDPDAARGTITVNGSSSEAATPLLTQGQLYLPVSAVAQAVGGHTSFVSEQDRVMVVTPRGRLTDVSLLEAGGAQRLVFELSSNVPFAVQRTGEEQVAISFERTSASRLPALPQGGRVRSVRTQEGAARTTVLVTTASDTAYSSYTIPDGRGYQLVVDFFESGERQVEAAQQVRIVIDPAHGGEDPGQELAGQAESEAALQLATSLARELERRGAQVLLTRREDNAVSAVERSDMGVGADLFLSLHVHDLQGQAVTVHYLGEAQEASTLELAIRQNAQAQLGETTDPLRRRLLLNLVPDLEVGRRYAEDLQVELFNRARITVADPSPAPLAVLEGAAGRGLLLEVPATVLAGAGHEGLAQALAGAVAQLVSAGTEAAGL